MAIESVAPRSNVIPFPGALQPRPRSIWRGVASLREMRIAAQEDDEKVFNWAAGMAWLEVYHHVDGSHPRLLTASDGGELELFDAMDPTTPDPRPGFKIVCAVSPSTCQTRIASRLRDHVSAHRG